MEENLQDLQLVIGKLCRHGFMYIRLMIWWLWVKELQDLLQNKCWMREQVGFFIQLS